MRIDTTIFDGVITNENSFTELFKNFLRFRPFRQVFLELINLDAQIDDIGFDNLDTQFTLAKFGRPDLALITEDTIVLFEIKVRNTSLTKNQPIGYYNYLKDICVSKNKVLVLITPKNYYDLKKYTKLLESLKCSDDTILTHIIHWETISSIIQKTELDSISPLFEEYSKFLTSWFQINSIFLDSMDATTMFGKEFPTSLEKTMLIVENVYKNFQNQGYVLKWSSDKDFSEYGFYFVLPDGEYGLFFGIWFDYWKETGNPICICTYIEATFHKFRNGIRRNNLNPSKEFQENHVTYFDKQNLMDVKCEEIISNILTDIATEMEIKSTITE